MNITYANEFMKMVTKKIENEESASLISEILMDCKPSTVSYEYFYDGVQIITDDELKAITTLCEHTFNDELQETYVIALLTKYGIGE